MQRTVNIHRSAKAQRQFIDSLESRRLLAAGFQIEVAYEASVNAAVQSVVNQAISRWQQVITGDVPDVGAGAWGAAVDDIRITARVKAIDGAGNGVAQARPLYIRSSASKLPIAGEIEIDSADIDSQTAAGTLFSIVTHEIGHALGFGTIWSQFAGLTTGLGGSDPLFVGTNALREYRNASGQFGATGVPLENTGGSGTRDAHWRETTFHNELMTGFVGGGLNPLSRVTLGQFEDLGYGVNYGAADAFSLGAASISGVIYNDLNKNGFRDSGEPGLAGASVYADLNWNGVFESGESVGTADASGNYTLSGLAAGGYAIRAITPAGTTVTAPSGGYSYVTLSAGQAVTGINFGIASTTTSSNATITGTAFNDANSNGTKDAGEAGISGVRIYIDSNYNGTYDGSETSVLTDASGNYSFTVAASAGGYSLRSVVPSGGTLVAPSGGYHWVPVSAGQTASGRNFAIRTGSTSSNAIISGTAFNDANSNGTKDAGEAGLSGVRIYIDNNYNGVFDSTETSVLTDASGNYSFTVAASAGGYSIRSVVPSGGTLVAPSGGYHWVPVSAGQTASGKNFAIRTGTVVPPTAGTISGKVFRDTNRDGTQNNGETGLSGYVVFLDTNYNGIRDANEIFATSGADGSYTLTNVAAGGYNVTIVLGSSTIVAPSSKFWWVTIASGGSVTGKNFAIA